MRSENAQNYGKKEKDTEKHHFTEDQIQKLMQLLDNSSNHNTNHIQGHNGENFTSKMQSKGKVSWILDTSAIDEFSISKGNDYLVNTMFNYKEISINI